MSRIYLWVLGVLGFGLAACGDDGGASTTSGSESADSGPTGDGATGDGATGDGSTGDGSTGEPTTGGEVAGKDVCERYIQCIAATTPNGLPDAQAGFGDDSACWTDPEDAALCVTACQTGLEQLHEAFPDEAACPACVSDEACPEGERCLKGGCTASDCGDGVVDPEEVCDGGESCANDCQGPAACNPVSGHPCGGSFCRLWISEEGDFEAAECSNGFEGDGEEPGDGCGPGDQVFEVYGCTGGLGCVPAAVANMSCGLPGCCMPFCDTAAPDCPAGQSCVEYVPVEPGYTVETSLGWLGVCVP